MEALKHVLKPIAASALALFVVASGAVESQPKAKTADAGPAAPDAAHSAVEQQRSASKKASDAAIDKEAVAAVEEARQAVKAIANGKRDEALAAIERAVGKIKVLTARKPSAALIPVKSEVLILDLAPKDRATLEQTQADARGALSSADYPRARYLLDQLASEIHVKTYNLPLATYATALQTAARLLDEKKTNEAKQTLVAALNTLVVTDQALPLPLIDAQGALKDAQAKRDQDKPAARQLLANAKQHLDRAKDLGYANKDPEYASLNQSIADLDKQLGGTESTTSGFAALRDKMTAFFERVTPKTQSPAQQVHK